MNTPCHHECIYYSQLSALDLARIKRLINRLFILICISICVLSAFNPNAALSQGFFDTATDDAFLPVEQAYQVFPSLESTDSSTDNRSALKLEWIAANGYYLYRHQFKVTVKNAQQAFELPLVLEDGKKKFDEYFNKELEIYYNATTVETALPDMEMPYEVYVQSQGCADAGLCYPPRTDTFLIESPKVILPITTTHFSGTQPTGMLNGASPTAKTDTPETDTNKTDTANEPANAFIPFVMLSAILGGIILNLMPCVFPVLSLKALSFANHAGGESHPKWHGWAYTGGAVGSFLVFALLILIAQKAGNILGWGFQLQNPIIVSLLAYLFFLMGLVLSGFMTVAGAWMGAGQNLTNGNSLTASFFTGVLAAVVASPCSGPFMASALGIAITQPPIVAFAIFGCLGFGMALPFLVLSYNPKLADHLPVPGAWMDTLKQFFAFAMYLTAIGLLWVLGRQVSGDAIVLMLLGATAIVFAVWLAKRSPERRTTKAIKFMLICASASIALIIATNINWVVKAHKYTWQPFSNQALTELRAQQTPVFVDLTADWCITCKVNERVALHHDEVFSKAKELGIVMMQGDWTQADPEITALLAQYGRNGVPLYLMYGNTDQARARVLPQILTKQMVIDAMNESVQ